MMNRITSRILIITILLWPALKAAATDYTLVARGNGIALYEKWITISTGGQAREIMVVFFARTSRDKVISILQDQDKGRGWNSNVTDYQVLQEQGKPGWITYIRYGVPWPVGDQDCCIAYNPGQDGVLYFNSIANPRFPVTDRITRINGVKGKWLFQDQDKGLLKITYIISSDKSRSLPKWVTDPVIHKNMLKNTSALIALLEKQ